MHVAHANRQGVGRGKGSCLRIKWHMDAVFPRRGSMFPESAMTYWYAITLAGAVFVATSIDDFVFVVCLLSGAGARPKAVILAKLINALLVVAIAALLVLCVGYLGGQGGGLLMGAPAIALGIYKLAWALGAKRVFDARMALNQTGNPSFWNCSLVFAAGSLDNVVGYAALFSGSAMPVIGVSIGVILVLSIVLCAGAYLVVAAHWRIFRPGKAWRFDSLVPYLLIFLGIRDIAAAYL
jgi:cadmium resistance protein CadD (predicted permease)